MLKDKMH